MYTDARVSSASGVLHRWVVQFTTAADAPSLSELQLFVSDFAEFMALGACAVGHDVECRLEGLDVSPDGARWGLAHRGSDVRYARLLRNALVAFGETVHAIGAATAEQEPAAGHSLPLAISPEEVARGTFYPPALPRLPFRVDRDEPYRLDRARRVLIEYARPLDDVIERSLERTIDLWERAARFGYCPSEEDLVSGDFGIHEVERAVFDEATYEVTIDVFKAPEEAFSSLLNALALMPERCDRIVLV